jgi:hypothetical protein
MTQEITHITVVPETKAPKDYQHGDLGQPCKSAVTWLWLLCCPGCGSRSTVQGILQHDDGTVSTVHPLHCHGSRMRQRYSIERNEVKWL